ncbi:MAG: hypothetical protein JW741_19000 [Sedimentisphaerales bacterium]|nr:hypothetical protein [Sedimentisphaerales bacterium]
MVPDRICRPYHEEWTEIVKAGGEAEEDELLDVQVQVMPGGVAVASYSSTIGTCSGW